MFIYPTCGKLVCHSSHTFKKKKYSIQQYNRKTNIYKKYLHKKYLHSVCTELCSGPSFYFFLKIFCGYSAIVVFTHSVMTGKWGRDSGKDTGILSGPAIFNTFKSFDLVGNLPLLENVLTNVKCFFGICHNRLYVLQPRTDQFSKMIMLFCDTVMPLLPFSCLKIP